MSGKNYYHYKEKNSLSIWFLRRKKKTSKKPVFSVTSCGDDAKNDYASFAGDAPNAGSTFAGASSDDAFDAAFDVASCNNDGTIYGTTDPISTFCNGGSGNADNQFSNVSG